MKDFNILISSVAKNKVLKSGTFQVLINGVGGQGLITLLKIISEAATIEGYDIRTSELHGLSQRGGSVEVHIRFGKEVYTPLVPQSKADLILSLETQEALNGVYYASPNTIFLMNKYQTPTFAKDLSEKEILNSLKKTSKNIFLVPASEVCQKELGTDVVSGVYLLGYAVYKNLPFGQNLVSRYARNKNLPFGQNLDSRYARNKNLPFGQNLVSRCARNKNLPFGQNLDSRFARNNKFLPLKPESILEAMRKVVPEKYLDLNFKTIELAKTNAR